MQQPELSAAAGEAGIQLSMPADRRHLHLQHGPIDLIIRAEGSEQAVSRAYQRAVVRFETVLTELVSEVSLLKQGVGFCSEQHRGQSLLNGSTAKRMWRAAVSMPGAAFRTPMIAVAGAVADEILHTMLDCTSSTARRGTDLTRVFVNNGGDIAVYLDDVCALDIGLVRNPQVPSIRDVLRLKSTDSPRGVATSGRHGRSLSLGIADSVTVLARNAAMADAAATLIANEIDLPGHRSIERVPAVDLDDTSDLQNRLVTVYVGALSQAEVARALARGQAVAKHMMTLGLIDDCLMCLQDCAVMCGKVLRRSIESSTRPAPVAAA